MLRCFFLYYSCGRLHVPTADHLPRTGRALDLDFYAFGYHLTGWHGWVSTKHFGREVAKSLSLLLLFGCVLRHGACSTQSMNERRVLMLVY
jgi:hypothetical protein